MTNFEKWKAELTKEGAAEFVKTGSKVCMACPAIKFCYHGMENINKPCSEVFLKWANKEAKE